MSERRRRSGGASDFDAIGARARAAVEAARRTVAESEVIATVLRLQRDEEGLLVRCAWCGRYSLGDEWLVENEVRQRWGLEDKFQADQITHSICPDCLRASSSIDASPEKGPP
jgi:hypothetical protein